MQTTLDRFAAEYQGGLTAGRAREQRKAIAALAGHAGCPIEQVTPAHFQSYLATLVEPYAPSYVVKIRRMILPFFTWARRADLITFEREHQLREIPNPVKAPAGLPRPYSQVELAAWWGALDAKYPEKRKEGLTFWRTGRAHYNRIWRHAWRLQLRAQAGLALCCGVRRSELFALTEILCHPDNAYVAVLDGKGGDAREIPHSSLSRLLLGEWISFRDELAPGHDSLWLGLNPIGGGAEDPRRPLSFKSFARTPADLGPFTWHRFRHTCGTEWLRAGMPVDKVQRLLGHSDLKMTMRYAKVVREDVRRAADASDETFTDAVAPPELRRAA